MSSALISGKVLPFPISGDDVRCRRWVPSPLPQSSHIGVYLRGGHPRLACTSESLVAPPPSAVAFPIPRDSGDLAAFCLRPSASDPPGGRRFVANTGPSVTRPTGDRTVESLFLSFPAVESNSISALFSLFYCSVGRGSQVPAFWLGASS